MGGSKGDENADPTPRSAAAAGCNGDGYLCEREAQASPVLCQAWPRVDADNNRTLDRGELGASEAGSPRP